MSINMGKKSRN